MALELGKAGETYPLGRLASVDDIAFLILFLGSNDAAFITGQNMSPDVSTFELNLSFFVMFNKLFFRVEALGVEIQR